MIIEQLSHTVLFDIDQIVASTGCPCPCSPPPTTTTTGAADLPRTSEDRASSGLAPSHGLNPPEVADLNMRRPEWRPDPAARRANDDDYILRDWQTESPGSLQRDADSILAEAQAMYLTAPIDILNMV